jgi:long-chain acyl-CoA synthetase
MTNFKSVPEMLLHRIASSPDSEAYQFPDGAGWKTLTWRQVGERVRDVASGLRALGLKAEERCAILSGTRFDWIVADLGILCAAGATTTIYPSNTPEECAYIIKDSDTVFVFAENDDQVAKLVAKRAEMPKVKKVITFDGKAGHGGWVMTLAELEEQGRAHHAKAPEQFEQIARAVQKDSLATLIYTSGTTGMPKGVELTHDCWVYEAEAIDTLKLLRVTDTQYLWLPLAHSFGKVLEAAQLHIGFKTAIDGRVDKLVENLGVIKPTFVAAVPRIFEKVYNKVVGGAKQGGGLKYAIFKWAVDVGRQVSALRQAGKEPGGLPRSRTRSPPSWSSRSCSSASEGGCASSSPAARRSRARWPSSFTPAAF